MKYTDPTGHREACDNDDNCRTRERRPPARSPWPTSIPRLGISPDEIVDTPLYQRIERRAEHALLNDLTAPVPNMGVFGGACTVVGCLEGSLHPAVDGPGDLGDPVYAAAYGEVIAVGYSIPSGDHKTFGNYVLIEHNVYGIRFYSVYAHLNTQLVKSGDIVDTATEIGTIGHSGNQGINNNHLHFEVRLPDDVNLSPKADDPFSGRDYWATSKEQMHNNWVDLGPIFGYDPYYPWQ